MSKAKELLDIFESKKLDVMYDKVLKDFTIFEDSINKFILKVQDEIDKLEIQDKKEANKSLDKARTNLNKFDFKPIQSNVEDALSYLT